MNEIFIIQRIIKISQIIVLLISIASFIYLGILTYLKRFEEVKSHLPIVLIGLFLLFTSYSIPVVMLSFLESGNIEKPTEKTDISFVNNPQPSFQPQIQPQPQTPPSSLPSQQYNISQNQPTIPTDIYNEDCIRKNLREAGGDKIRGYVTSYGIKIQNIEFKMCVVGSEEFRSRLFGINGVFHEKSEWIANRLYQIKKKVPLIKNQPEWFTYAYIMEVDFLDRIIGRLPNRVCPEGSMGSFREGGGGRSIFYYCYVDFNNELSRTKDKIDTMVSHEAAHALDRRAGINNYLSLKRNSDVYKFIDKYVKAAFGGYPSYNEDIFTLGGMSAYFRKGLFCNGKKIETPYLESDFIEPYYEYFADLLAPFLACDDNYRLPEKNKNYFGISNLREKFDELINVLKKYGFIY